MYELNQIVIIELQNETNKQRGMLHSDPSKNTGFVLVNAEVLDELLWNAENKGIIEELEEMIEDLEGELSSLQEAING